MAGKKGQRRLSTAEKQEIKRRFLRRESVRSIAKVMGRSIKAVDRCVQRAGMKKDRDRHTKNALERTGQATEDKTVQDVMDLEDIKTKMLKVLKEKGADKVSVKDAARIYLDSMEMQRKLLGQDKPLVHIHSTGPLNMIAEDDLRKLIEGIRKEEHKRSKRNDG